VVAEDELPLHLVASSVLTAMWSLVWFPSSKPCSTSQRKVCAGRAAVPSKALRGM
jgi:hypothetical protein